MSLSVIHRGPTTLDQALVNGRRCPPFVLTSASSMIALSPDNSTPNQRFATRTPLVPLPQYLGQPKDAVGCLRTILTARTSNY